jgi:hypothetical protein
LKYLLTAALVALLIWLIYRRLRPYIQMLRQFISAVRGTIETGTQSELHRDTQNAESKLVRCANCDTWVPQARAFGANSAFYCSRVCLELAAKIRRRKAAS